MVRLGCGGPPESSGRGVERGDLDSAWDGIDAFSGKFEKALEMSVEDGRKFCLFLVVLTFMFKRMSPFMHSIADREWEKWMQRAWRKGG